MAVIIFNKNTGKYLKKHSGSVNSLRWSTLHRLRKNLGTKTSYYRRWETLSDEERKELDILLDATEKAMFGATAEDARVYHSASSALNSIGRRTKNHSRTSHKQPSWHKVLPDHLEIHEIKMTTVCVMRPDGTSNCDEEST